MFSLVLLFLRVGLLSFGGGNAAMPYIEHEVVDNKKWITKEEFYELLVVSNSLPGPNMIQVSGYIGKMQFGFLGMIAAPIAMLFPPTFLFTLTMVYAKDYINEEIMNKIVIGAIWFILALLINLIYRLTKSSVKSKSNNFGVLLLFIMSITLLLLKLNTAIIISANIFIIFIASLILTSKTDIKDSIELEKEVIENA